MMSFFNHKINFNYENLQIFWFIIVHIIVVLFYNRTNNPSQQETCKYAKKP